MYNRGVTLLNQNKHREALPYFDAAIKANPLMTEPLVNKGVCLDSLGYHEQAIECYTKAIKVEPKLSAAYDNRGSSKLVLKRYSEALEDFNKSISLPRISPLGSVAIYSDRARAYAGLGRFKECFRDFDYLELTEWSGPFAREALAMAYFARVATEGGENALRLFEQRPKDGEYEKFCTAASMVHFLKKERTQDEVLSSCANSKEREGVAVVGSWIKIRTSDKPDETLAQLKSSLIEGDPLATPYLMTVAILRRSELKQPDPAAESTEETR